MRNNPLKMEIEKNRTDCSCSCIAPHFGNWLWSQQDNRELISVSMADRDFAASPNPVDNAGCCVRWWRQTGIARHVIFGIIASLLHIAGFGSDCLQAYDYRYVSISLGNTHYPLCNGSSKKSVLQMRAPRELGLFGLCSEAQNMILHSARKNWLILPILQWFGKF